MNDLIVCSTVSECMMMMIAIRLKNINTAYLYLQNGRLEQRNKERAHG